MTSSDRILLVDHRRRSKHLIGFHDPPMQDRIPTAPPGESVGLVAIPGALAGLPARIVRRACSSAHRVIMSEIGPGAPTSLQWSEHWAEFSDHFISTGGTLADAPLFYRGQNSRVVMPLPCNHGQAVEDPHQVDSGDGQDSGTLENAHREANGDVVVDIQQQCDLVHFTTGYEPGKATRKTCRDRNWTEDVTSVLVECKRLAFCDKACPFRKHKSSATNWEAVSKELRNNPDTRASEKTGDQCRLRWDTLVKSHRIIKEWCMQTKKGYAELAEEINGLTLATTLKEEWYEVIDTISRNTRSQKCDNLPPSARVVNPESRIENVPFPVVSRIPPAHPGSHPLLVDGAPPVSTRNSPPSSSSAQVSKGMPEPGNFSPKQINIPGFASLDGHLRSTLLDLILGTHFLRDRWLDVYDRDDQTLSFCCQWLSLVQNRSCSDIYNDVIVLAKMELVHFSSLYGSRFRVFDKFVKKVIRDNPSYDIHRHFKLLDDTKFISARDFSVPQRIRVLKLDRCLQLTKVDFRGLRKLRALFLYRCLMLKEVNGWKFLRELAWLEIDECPSFHDYPDLQSLPSLKEFRFNRYYVSDCPPRSELGISQCVRLRRLEIWEDNLLEESGDLSSLKCLEILSFNECFALSTIAGLSGLHSLTSLSVAFCLSLRMLPDLSHMKELACIDIHRTNLEEIPGVEKLVSLKTLDCRHSKLKRLPDLHHLPALQKVRLEETPLIEDDPSSFYFDKAEVLFNCEETRHVDVSDISDAEHNLSDSSGD